MSISIHLEPRLEQVLDKYCTERQTNKNAVIQQALEEFLTHISQTGNSLFLDHPFVGGEPGEDPEAARQSKQRLRDRMSKSTAAYENR